MYETHIIPPDECTFIPFKEKFFWNALFAERQRQHKKASQSSSTRRGEWAGANIYSNKVGGQKANREENLIILRKLFSESSFSLSVKMSLNE